MSLNVLYIRKLMINITNKKNEIKKHSVTEKVRLLIRVNRIGMHCLKNREDGLSLVLIF